LIPAQMISPCEIGFYHGLPDFTNSSNFSIFNASDFNSSSVNGTNATDACAPSWNGQRHSAPGVRVISKRKKSLQLLQGYLAHKKPPPPPRTTI